MRGATMSSKAAASGLVIFLLSESVLWAQNDWGVTYPSNQICALKGSTVEIHSTYTYPSRINDRITTVEETFWFTEGQGVFGLDLATDSQYTGRLEYHLQDNKCTLRITDLSESDSAVYKFRFITNQECGKYTGLAGVTLSVTDLQVQVEESSTQSEMKCHSSCNVADNGSYVWYNNGQKMDEDTSSRKVSVNDKGNYSCAVQGYEDYRSPPVYIPKLPSVSVCPSGEIVEGSAVSLTCSTDANSPPTYTWYKTNGNPDVQALSKEPLLVFRSIQPSDSGEYYCMVESKLGKRASVSIFIDVKYPPKLPSVSVSPSGEIIEGSTVNLTCSSHANPAAEYTWFKENQTPLQAPRGSYSFTSVSSEDGGIYHCKSENKHGQINSSSLLIIVQYAPKLASVSVSPSGEIMEGSTVNLTCSSDANPAANYTWYKENQTLLQGPEGIYRFTSISSENRGFYQCKSENQHGEINSSSVFIDIQYAPRLPFVSVSPSGEIIEGSAVNLTCSSDANPAANYTWYKENQTVLQGPEGIYRFTSISSENRGFYQCKSENQHGEINSSSVFIDIQYAPKLASVSVSPSGEIMEGSTVNLTCSSDANPAVNYTWYKENQTLLQGPEGIYRFTSISSENRGFYQCKSENQHGEINSSSVFIDIQYAPKLASVSVSPSGEIMEGSTVNLTCSSDANPAVNYTWYKENQTVLQGPEGIYRFTSISSENRGFYQCKSENQHGEINSSSVFIDIQYAPRLPFVSVSPSGEIIEGSAVNLTCSSDANPAANYTWYKENEDSPKASGQNFTITDFRPEHSGNYYCEAHNKRGRHNSTLHLTVVAGAWKLIAAATVPAVSLVIILISVLLWIIKKRVSKQPSGAEGRPDNREQMQPVEQQGYFHYASVRFSKNQPDPIYSNIRAAPPRRYKENKREEETVEYTAVTFNSASTARRTTGQEAAEDPSTLYSTINKHRKHHGKRNP